MIETSARWQSTRDYDVDAFLLDQSKSWMLFIYLKIELSVQAVRDLFLKLASQFDSGDVSVVSGAMKTEKQSVPLDPYFVGQAQDEVWALEEHALWPLFFRLETRDVLNPGLFLDQRANRQTLIEKVSARPDGLLLNFFSYTGAFSVAALRAGAMGTVSIDASARYLDWERQNIEKNSGIDSVKLSRRYCDDARAFLKRAVRRESKYRWIVIDPPTFSRGKSGVFQVQRELIGLVRTAAQCLEPGGSILVSTNDVSWAAEQFDLQICSLATELKMTIEAGQTDASFEGRHPLKSAWLT